MKVGHPGQAYRANGVIDRTNPTTRAAEVYDSAVGPARGILRGPLECGGYQHARRSPAPALVPFIAHYWLIHWDLPDGVSRTVETLPHPNVHLVFTSGDPISILVHGVHTGKFTRVLRGCAHVFGVKFRAGGGRPFFGCPLAALRGKTVDARQIFGREIERLGCALTGDQPEEEKIDRANRFFLERLPARDADADLAASVVDLIFRRAEVQNVAELVSRTSVNERSLQRLFRECVGVSPKWVIRRYRLHELVERLNSGARLDWAVLAAELGYFDQSHLIRDFRRLTGYTPEKYARDRIAR
jgi:AraC-like DNA-binding protein